MIEAVITRCAGGCKVRMTQDEALAHAAVICIKRDADDIPIGTLTLAVCDDCAGKGGRERAEIIALKARAIYQS